MSITELGEWLSQHKNEIPQKPTWKRTLLDIMGCTKLENRWSDLYQFFLLEEEEHGLKDLFIRSLEELIGVDKGWMKNFCVLREDSTRESSIDAEEDCCEKQNNDRNSHKKEKGRIDLLILGEDKKAIIIENKVFHTLDNPLEQYVKTTKAKGWTDIKVIVLALYNNYGDIDSIDGCECLNLTHSNYIIKVMEKLPNYLSEANSFYLLILKNFIQNIINVTNMSATDDELLFFSKEFEYISKIQGLYSRIIREYKSSLNKIKFKYDELKPDYKSINDDDNNQLVYFQYKESPNLYLTVMLNYLWNKEGQNKPFVRIVLEIHPDGKNLEEIDKVIRKQIAEQPKDDTNVKYSNLEDKNKLWRHLAYVDYDIQFENGEQFIRPEELVTQIKNIKLSESKIYKLGKEVINLINSEK